MKKIIIALLIVPLILGSIIIGCGSDSNGKPGQITGTATGMEPANPVN